MKKVIEWQVIKNGSHKVLNLKQREVFQMLAYEFINKMSAVPFSFQYGIDLEEYSE